MWLVRESGGVAIVRVNDGVASDGMANEREKE